MLRCVTMDDQTRKKEKSHLYCKRRFKFLVSSALWIVPICKRIHVDITFNVSTRGSLNGRRLFQRTSRHATSDGPALKAVICCEIADFKINFLFANTKK